MFTYIYIHICVCMYMCVYTYEKLPQGANTAARLFVMRVLRIFVPAFRVLVCVYVCIYTRVCIYECTEIPTIIVPSATINYPSATGSIIVGISLPIFYMRIYIHIHVRTTFN
jgi:hypothetical protein